MIKEDNCLKDLKKKQKRKKVYCKLDRIASKRGQNNWTTRKNNTER